MNKKAILNGLELSYTDLGVGHPVVLMHGWGCTRETVLSIERLLTPGFRVLNLDMPGSGASAEPESPWGVDDYNAMLEALVEHEHLDNPILIGHSNGGRVAIRYAARHTVRKLILIDAAGIKPRRSLSYYWKVYSYKTVKHLARLLMGREQGERWLDRYRSRVGSSDYNTSTPVMRATMSRLVNTDLRHLLPDIACPTLLIWGANDTATPLRDAQLMERLIPDAGLVTFAGCGDYSFLDNPVQFAAVLNSFLDSDKTIQS